MDVPESLPHMLYLLAYDTRARRMTAKFELGYVIRAAALTELQLAGHLTDRNGKPHAQGPTALADPFLNDLLHEIAVARPRSWQRWISKDVRKAPRIIRDALAAANVVKLEPYRVLGLFPATRVTVPDPRVVTRLADRVSAALGSPASRTEPRDAAMVTLAAAGEFKTVLPRARRREHRRRLADLGEAAGPVSEALRRAVRQARSSAAGV